MKAYSKLLFSTLIIGGLLGGCAGKDGDPGPAGATGAAGTPGTPGQNLTGTLFGFVSPTDEFGSPLSKSGVTVTLEGVTPATTATTDANGRYEFPGLRTGTYNLSFARTGLATLRRLGVGHVGGDQPTFLGTNALTTSSTTSVTPVTLTNTNSTTLTLNFPFSNVNAPSGSVLRAIVYVSSTANPTSATAVSYTILTTSGTSGMVLLTKAGLNNLGFASGTQAYAVVYGTPSSLLSYPDLNTGRPIYVGLGPASNTISFIVP